MDYVVVTNEGCKLASDSKRWLSQYKAEQKYLSKHALRRLPDISDRATVGPSVDLPLRSCQMACLEACVQGARVVEMACGTGKTRIIRELAENTSGKAPCIAGGCERVQ